jgi:hypothetical protein
VIYRGQLPLIDVVLHGQLMTAPLVIPILSPSGTLHFTSVDSNASIDQVIVALLQTTIVSREVLGGLDDNGWALQRIRRWSADRIWQQEELETLKDGEIAWCRAQFLPFTLE